MCVETWILSAKDTNLYMVRKYQLLTRLFQKVSSSSFRWMILKTDQVTGRSHRKEFVSSEILKAVDSCSLPALPTWVLGTGNTLGLPLINSLLSVLQVWSVHSFLFQFSHPEPSLKCVPPCIYRKQPWPINFLAPYWESFLLKVGAGKCSSKCTFSISVYWQGGLPFNC